MLCTNHNQTFLQRLQNLTIYTGIYDVQLHLNNGWIAGRSLDTPGVDQWFEYFVVEDRCLGLPTCQLASCIVFTFVRTHSMDPLFGYLFSDIFA